MPTQPHRSIVWLLRQTSSRAAADAAVGDVLDDLTLRTQAMRAPRWPRLWVNMQAVKLVFGFASSAMPRLLRSAWRTVSDAARSLRRSPGYSTLIVILLTVGITAGTITYSVVDAVVLRPLAIDQGDRLVTVGTRDDKFKVRISSEAFRQIHDQVTSFDGVAKVGITGRAVVTIGSGSDEVDLLRASSDLFQVLRFGTAIGRVWTAQDEMRGDTAVAVLGYRYWIDHFRGDPGVLGMTIVDGRYTYRIIGVLAADTDVPGLSYSMCAVWIPSSESFSMIGRLRPGVSTSQVADDIQRAIGTPDWRPKVTPLLDGYVRQVRVWMLMALGAAGLVVLIACFNAANIMLTRSLRRARELAIRSSLGASRWQITLSVMTEGVLLSLTASACALLFSIWGIVAAKTAVLTLPFVFRASTISLNGRVLTAAIAAAFVTGVLASLVPAWQASRTSVSGVLKNGGPTVAGGGRRWRSALLVGEIASVTVLLVVSLLFAISLVRMAGIDLGVDRSHLVAVSPRLEFNGTVDDVRKRIESVPGVTGVAVTAGGASLPLIGRAFGGAWITSSIQRTDAPADVPPLTVLQYRVTANFFAVAGVRFRRGTGWQEETAFDAPSVVIDDWAATQLFGSDDPLGRQVRATEPAGIYTVVGIVPHMYAKGPEDPVEPVAYFALRPSPTRKFAGLFVRTAPPADDMVPIVTNALAPLAPPTKSPYIHAAEDAVRRITATRRFTGGMMSAYGAIAILLGAAGVYGVIAAIVAQQTREIGVRLALGATPRLISRDVLALTGRHVLVGLTLGLPLAWWISRGFAAYLFQVTPADPSMYIGVAVLVAAVGVARGVDPCSPRGAHRSDDHAAIVASSWGYLRELREINDCADRDQLHARHEA